ncbi:Bccp2p [Stylosanthes scabra]|uniref:Biotin carboxyl carrier protein of acetyl-CoA carboxylase n=1 Tax=Stylosanthes scabra TaxID=79078 RepID=A0ABU6XJJ8_9FABA|nr:Bccp2p [Stylosanthes scabra]
MGSFSVPCPKCPSPSLGLNSQKLLKPSLSFGSLPAESSASSGIRCLNGKQVSVQKLQAQRGEAVTTIENSAPVLVNGPKVAAPNQKEDQNGKPFGGTTTDPSFVSAFMAQVADLVKLVDSRDIVELQLKQSDCELMIRKKEALEPPPQAIAPPASVPMHYAAFPPPPPLPPAVSSTPASSPPAKAAPALPSPGKASTSGHPPLKSPMSGTFYRSPAPGEPPFVKVGDKVQKGQVVCIIEAMKLMNEIEADQSGTVTEILAEDGKPVSLDTPLFVIAP